MTEAGTPIPGEYELFGKALAYLCLVDVTWRIVERFELRILTLAGIGRKHYELVNRRHKPLPSYKGLNAGYNHEVVDHAECYVKGKVHTNGLENFWSLLKRGIRGTYVSVEPFHLFRYLDEQAFRFNERDDNDQGRFLKAVKGILGKGLTYSSLTGKDQAEGGLIPA